MESTHPTSGGAEVEVEPGLDQPLLLEIFVRFPIVNVSFLVLEFLHRLLLKDLISAFPLQLLRHWKYVV